MRGARLALLKIFDTDSPAFLNDDAGDQDPCLDRQVRLIERWPQVGLAGAPPLAILDDELEETAAFLLRPVESALSLWPAACAASIHMRSPRST